MKSRVMELGVSKLGRCLEVRKSAYVVSRPLSRQTRHIPGEDRKSKNKTQGGKKWLNFRSGLVCCCCCALFSLALVEFDG